MKLCEKILFILPIISLFTVSGCGSQSVPSEPTTITITDTSVLPPTSVEEPTNSEPPAEVCNFNTFKDAIESAKPTEIFYESVTNYLEYDLQLNSTSLFLIEYDDEIKGKYTYSYEKLNPLPADEFISKINGTAYVKGKTVYSLTENNKLEECNEGQFSIQLANIILRENYFEEDYIIDVDNEILTGAIKDNRLYSFFNGKEFEISNCQIKVKLKNKQLYSINFDYVTKNGGDVEMLFEYSYEYVKVNIPNA